MRTTMYRLGATAAALLLGAAVLPLTGATAAAARTAAKSPARTAATGAAEQCSAAPLTMSYYRTWRDVSVAPSTNKAVMSELPAAVDVAFVFEAYGSMEKGYGKALRDTYVPALHKQGTQVVRTLGIQQLLDLPVQGDAAGYDALAKQLIADYLTPAGLDGFDVDVERSLDAAQVDHVAALFTALSKYLGPKSGTGGLLIYDTNQNGTTALFGRVAPLISYVLVQSYGRNVSGLQATWATYAPRISSCRYLIGFSFYEENGQRWGDTTGEFTASRAHAYAKWQPQGGRKGGIFSYAVDRDGKAEGDNTITPTTYDWTKRLATAQG